MSPLELIVLLSGAAGVGVGSAWWGRRAQRAHVAETRTAWVRAGRRVLFGPVAAASYGTLPRQRYARAAFGAAGLVDAALVFEGQHARGSFDVPSGAVQHLSLVTVRLQPTRLGTARRALAVHYLSPDGWRVAMLSGDEIAGLADALASATGLPLHDAGDQRDDFGPAQAVRMLEDLYGDWTPDHSAPLYLAPDRLLFNWRDAIPLRSIQRLDVYDMAGGAGAPLLRVEFETAGGAETVGFALADAPAWADAIVRRIDVPLQVHAGRKKKKRGD